MTDKHKLQKILDEDYYSYLARQDVYSSKDYNFPEDDRYWKSNVRDIRGGDNFADYCKYIFKLYEEEEIDYC